jgi:hypothetical protein
MRVYQIKQAFRVEPPPARVAAFSYLAHGTLIRRGAIAKHLATFGG